MSAQTRYSPNPAGIRFAVTFTHFCGTWSQYACTPRKRQCELRQGLTSKFRTVCSRVFSGESRELEHQAEGFDLRVLAHVQWSRDDSRGGGGRERESKDPERMRNVSGTNLSPAAAMAPRCERDCVLCVSAIAHLCVCVRVCVCVCARARACVRACVRACLVSPQ